MWLMLQQEQPEDYVLGTGVTHSVKEFCEAAFGYLGLDLPGLRGARIHGFIARQRWIYWLPTPARPMSSLAGDRG